MRLDLRQRLDGFFTSACRKGGAHDR
jgi:hypothetical protein